MLNFSKQETGKIAIRTESFKNFFDRAFLDCVRTFPTIAGPNIKNPYSPQLAGSGISMERVGHGLKGWDKNDL